MKQKLLRYDIRIPRKTALLLDDEKVEILCTVLFVFSVVLRISHRFVIAVFQYHSHASHPKCGLGPHYKAANRNASSVNEEQTS